MPIFSSTITDIVSNKMSQPYYRFDGSLSNKIEAPLVAEMDNLERELSMTALVRWHDDEAGGDFVNLGWDARLRVASNTIQWILDWGDDGDSGMINTGISPVAGELAHWVFTFDGASSATEGTAKLYKNGVEVYTSTSTDYYHAPTSGAPGTINIGTSPAPASYAGNDAEIYKVQVWNKTLTATEVKEIYSGASVPYKYKGAKRVLTSDYSSNNGSWSAYGNNTVTNSNNIVAITYVDHANGGYHYFNDGAGAEQRLGRRYRITITAHVNTGAINIGFNNNGTYTTPLVFSETSATTKSFEWTAKGGSTSDCYIYGQNSYGSGEVFYITSVVMDRIGAVAEYDGSGISSDKWFDKSGNDLHGTVSGATVENAPSGDSGLVYEEGTWTPNWYGTGGGGSHSFNGEGKYTRIGNMVYAKFDKAAFSFTSDMGSGSLRISGLPFVGEVNSSHQSCSTDPYYYPGSTWQSTNECGILFLKHSNTDIMECRIRDVAGDSDTAFPVSRLEGESNVYFGCNFIYRIS